GQDRFGTNIPQAQLSRLAVGKLPSLPELMRATPRDFADKERARYFRAGAWALVHMLNNDDVFRKRFSAYLSALAAGDAQDVAWTGAFHGLSVGALETHYRRHPLLTETKVFRTPNDVHVAPSSPSVTALSDADVELLWARSWSWNGARERALAAPH